MPDVMIEREFNLTHQDGTTELFPPGIYDLDDELANHWYVRAHTKQQPEQRGNQRRLRVRPGTPEAEAVAAHTGHQDAQEDARMRQEIAEATASIRDKYNKERVERRAGRARLSDEAKAQVQGEPGEDESREAANAEAESGGK